MPRLAERDLGPAATTLVAFALDRQGGTEPPFFVLKAEEGTAAPAMADPVEATKADTAGAAVTAVATRRPQGDLLRGRVDGRPP